MCHYEDGGDERTRGSVAVRSRSGSPKNQGHEYSRKTNPSHGISLSSDCFFFSIWTSSLIIHRNSSLIYPLQKSPVIGPFLLSINTTTRSSPACIEKNCATTWPSSLIIHRNSSPIYLFQKS